MELFAVADQLNLYGGVARGSKSVLCRLAHGIAIDSHVIFGLNRTGMDAGTPLFFAIDDTFILVLAVAIAVPKSVRTLN